MHHFHISTPALFVIGAFIIAVFILIIWASRPPKQEPKVVYRDPPPVPQRSVGMNPALGAPYAGSTPASGYAQSAGYAPMAGYQYPPGHPNYYPGAGYGSGNNNGFVEGMLIGELMSDRRPEVIVEREGYGGGGYAPEARPEAPARDEGGISWDSGPDTSSSSNDSGGGADF